MLQQSPSALPDFDEFLLINIDIAVSIGARRLRQITVLFAVMTGLLSSSSEQHTRAKVIGGHITLARTTMYTCVSATPKAHLEWTSGRRQHVAVDASLDTNNADSPKITSSAAKEGPTASCINSEQS
ncbi:hypothetical protein DPSP01_012206 [Paraphaeosphaeria sporulosa]